MAWFSDVPAFCPSSSAELELAQESDKRQDYGSEDRTDDSRFFAALIHDRFHDKWNHDVKDCICVPADIGRDGLCQNASYAVCLLGIYFDEYSYRPALGHDHGNDEKNDGNQKDVGDSDQRSAHTGTGGKRVWNLCICKTGYCFVSVFTEYVCVF